MKLKLSGVCACLALPLTAAPTHPLDWYRWRERVLVIATPSLDDARYQAQAAALLPEQEELAQRRITTLVMLPGDQNRAKLAIADDDFMVAFVGLDGGLKAARRAPLTGDEVLSEADRTSTRKSELATAIRERTREHLDAPVSATEIQSALNLREDPARGIWTNQSTAPSTETPELGLETCLLPTPFAVLRMSTAGQTEICTFLSGDPVEVLLLPAAGAAQIVRLGPDYLNDQVPQLRIPTGTRFTLRALKGGRQGWTVFSRTASAPIAPPTAEEEAALLERFPEQAEWIRAADRYAR